MPETIEQLKLRVNKANDAITALSGIPMMDRAVTEIFETLIFNQITLLEEIIRLRSVLPE